MSTRLLGTVGLITCPLLLIEGILSGFHPAPPNRLNATLGLLFIVGWAANAIGLRALRASGDRPLSMVLFAVQMVGLVLASMQQVQDFIYTSDSPKTMFYRVCDLAWPLSVLFMLVVGGAVLVTKRLEGWRRWAPLLCGLAVPILLAAMAVARQQVAILVFGLYTCAAWALLSVAVRSGAHTPAPN